MYNINEVAVMTGLSTRTLRNYLKMGVLDGEKIDGVWQFSEEHLGEFLRNPVAAPSIQAKRNALIFDFLADRKNRQTKCAWCWTWRRMTGRRRRFPTFSARR